jgi:hypothetical protein
MYVLLLGAAVSALATQGSQASAFNLTDTVGWKPGSPGSAIVTDSNPFATVNSVVPTVSFGISNAFNQGLSAGTPLNGNFPGTVATGNGGPWNFYDNYVFSLGAGSNIQSTLISFTLPNGSPGNVVGISDLQARIIQIGPSPNPNYQNQTFDSIAASQLDGPPVTTIVDGWQTNQTTLPGGSNYYSVLLNQHQFGTGLYDVQIRGLVASSNGIYSGSYGGSISFTPVPLPAAVWLLASGLLGVGGLTRRRHPLGCIAS